MISRSFRALSAICAVGVAGFVLAGQASAQQGPQPGSANGLGAPEWAAQMQHQEREQLQLGDRPDWAAKPEHAGKPEWGGTAGQRGRPDWARMPDFAGQQNQATPSGGLGANLGATSGFGGPQANSGSFRSNTGSSNRRR